MDAEILAKLYIKLSELKTLPTSVVKYETEKAENKAS